MDVELYGITRKRALLGWSHKQVNRVEDFVIYREIEKKKKRRKGVEADAGKGIREEQKFVLGDSGGSPTQ